MISSDFEELSRAGTFVPFSQNSKYKTNGLDQASPIYSYQTQYTSNLAGNFCMEKQTKFSPVGSVKKKKKGENGSIKRPYGFTAA